MAVLAPLLLLAAALFAWGVLYGGKSVADALISLIKITVGKAPFISWLIGKPAIKGLQALSNKLGTYADSVGGEVSTMFHKSATVFDRIGWAIFHTNVALERLFWHVTVGYPLHVLWDTAHKALRLASKAGHIPDVFTKTTTIVVKEVGHPGSTALGKAIRSAVAVAVRPLKAQLRWERDKLLALEASMAGVKDLPGDVKPIGLEGLKDALAKIKARLGKLENGALPIVGTGVVAIALAQLGLGALRCGNVKGAARAICGMDANLLGNLLVDALAIYSVVSVRQFAQACQFVEDDVINAVAWQMPELGSAMKQAAQDSA